MPGLEEAYFLSVFIGGLSDDIRPMGKMSKPKTLLQAWESAKLKEELVENSRKPKPFIKRSIDQILDQYKTNTYYQNPITYNKSTLPNQNSSYPPKLPNSESSQNWKTNPTTIFKAAITQPSTSTIQSSTYSNQQPTQSEKRSAKPYFRCGERYFPRHICKAKSVMAVQIEEIESVGNEEAGQEEVTADQMEDGNDEMTLSFHAFKGNQGTNTIKLLTAYKNRQLVVLVDSCSTNSFFG